MRVLYNEWDEPTAAWLRELINGRHLPSGPVDTRSIGDVRADDLQDFDQCHFFAGIGGWPLALRWAGLEGTSGVWTGSPPCQPFSVAGKGLGQADERHLAPVWLDLIRERKPGLIFGEQVADAIRAGNDRRLLGLPPATIVAACLYACDTMRIEASSFLRRFSIMDADSISGCADDFEQFAVACAIYEPEQSLAILARQALDGVRETGWLDDLFDALEECGYACGAAVLPACSVGAPHIRKRLFFGAVRLADAYCWSAGNGDVQSGREHGLFTKGGSSLRKGCEGPRGQSDGLANSYSSLSDRARPFRASRWTEHPERSDARRLADPDDTRPQGRAGMPERADEQPAGPGSVAIGLAYPPSARRRQAGCDAESDREAHERWARDRDGYGSTHDVCSRMVRTPGTDPHHGFWSGADWLGCRDGKFRPVEPGTQPLATGIPARVVRLRGYGNAIVPQVAAQFITEFLGAIADMQDEGLTP